MTRRAREREFNDAIFPFQMYSTKRSITIEPADDDDLEPELAICRQSSAAAATVISREPGWPRVLFVIIVFIANTAYSGLRVMPF